MITALQVAAAKPFPRMRGALVSMAVSFCLLVSSALGWAEPAIAQTLTPPATQTQPSEYEPISSSPSGSQLFTENCAACHAGGGNLIRRGKTLKQNKLKRYGYEAVDAIASLIALGKGAMPAFGERLAAEEIDAIAQYVQTQAASGWK